MNMYSCTLLQIMMAVTVINYLNNNHPESAQNIFSSSFAATLACEFGHEGNKLLTHAYGLYRGRPVARDHIVVRNEREIDRLGNQVLNRIGL